MELHNKFKVLAPSEPRFVARTTKKKKRRRNRREKK
jgi:hypothetical protein